LDDYHNYVIKGTRMVGKFDELYQDWEDQWEQTTREENALEKFIGLELLSKYGNCRFLEYGCGLGYYTQLMFEKFGA